MDKQQSSFPKTSNWTAGFRENPVDVIPGFIEEEKQNSKVIHRRKIFTPTRRLRPVTDYEVRVSFKNCENLFSILINFFFFLFSAKLA